MSEGVGGRCGDAGSRGEVEETSLGTTTKTHGEMPTVVVVDGLLRSLFTSRNRKSMELAGMMSVTLQGESHSKYVLLDGASRRYHLCTKIHFILAARVSQSLHLS